MWICWWKLSRQRPSDFRTTERRVLLNGSTRQQPVTSYGVKNKSTELHLTSVVSLPPPASSPFMLAQPLFLPFSVMLHPTDHEWGGTNRPAAPQHTPARVRIHVHLRCVNSSRWSSKRKIIERNRGRETEKERQKERGRRSRSYLTGWPRGSRGPPLCQFLVIPWRSFRGDAGRNCAAPCGT